MMELLRQWLTGVTCAAILTAGAVGLMTGGRAPWGGFCMGSVGAAR